MAVFDDAWVGEVFVEGSGVLKESVFVGTRYSNIIKSIVYQYQMSISGDDL